MDVRAEFQSGRCLVYLTPSDGWEKKLLGALAKGGAQLNASVRYKPEGHSSYGICSVVEILLEAPETSE